MRKTTGGPTMSFSIPARFPASSHDQCAKVAQPAASRSRERTSVSLIGSVSGLMGDDIVSSDPQAGMPPRALRDRVSSAGKGARVHALKASDALVETVGGLADRAIDRVLLTREPVTSAADGKRLLAGQADTEAFADDIQRVVVTAVPVVRTLARGATFTKVPWVMVASSAVSIGVAVRTGVRELQVLSSLVAHRLEEAGGGQSDPTLVLKLAIDLN